MLFGLNVTLTLVFNFTVLLSYRAILVFLVQKFSCPVATHGHEPSSLKYGQNDMNSNPENLQKNHIFTSGASGTNAAVIRGALRAEKQSCLL